MILKSITELFDDETNSRILTCLYHMIMDEDEFYEEVTMDVFSDDFIKNKEILNDVAFDEYVVSMGGDYATEIKHAINANLPRVLAVLQGDDSELGIVTINMDNEFYGLLNTITALYIVEVQSCMDTFLDGLIEYDIKEALCDQAIKTLNTEIANEDLTSIYELFEACDSEVLKNYVTRA